MDKPAIANGPPLVLIVDDDFDIREALRDVLEDAGYRVDQAVNGADAWSYLARNVPPAAILLDLLMPIMTGHELLLRLRSSATLKSIPTIVMTASAHAPVDPQVPLLHKPMLTQELLKLLLQIVPTHHRQPVGHAV